MNTEEPRLELDVDSWGTFKLVDIFNIEKPKGPTIGSMTLSQDGIPIICKSKNNEGVATIGFNKPSFKTNMGNCLTLPIGGSSNTFWSTYRESDQEFLTATGDLLIFRLKVTETVLNKYIASFLNTIFRTLNQQKYRHFGYNLTSPRLKKETIKLPQTSSGEPDWDFMENYIKHLKEDIPVISEVHEPSLELDVDSWTEFKIEDLFDMERPKGVKFQDTTPGTIPLIRASKEKEGVHSFVSPIDGYKIHKGNCITRPTNGDVPHATFRRKDEDFMLMGNAMLYRLKEKELTREIGLFIVTIMRLLADKFGFSYVLNSTRMKAETIKLPTTSKGTPDWDFMERYIKEIEGASSN